MSRQIDTSKPLTAEEAEYLRQRGRLPEGVEIEGGDEAPTRATEYESKSKKELRIELKRRDRDYSDANKDELVARLLQADEEDGDEPRRMKAPKPQHGAAQQTEADSDDDNEDDDEE